MEGIFESLKPYFNVLLIGGIGVFLAFVTSQLLSRIFARSMGAGWSKLVGGLTAVGIIFWTIKLILDTAGAAGLVVVLVTILTAAFAIGSERVAADLVSGVSLFLSRPYQIGDIVSVAGHEGKVSSISVNQTTLESLYGDRIFIRNSDVVAGTIVNYSASPGHLLTTMVIVPATEDLNVAVDVVEKAIQNFSPELSGSPYRPSLSIESGEPGYANIEVRVYVKERLDYGPEKTRLFLLVTNTLKGAGLSLAPIE